MKDNTIKITLEINNNKIVLEGDDLTNESKDKFFDFFMGALRDIKSFERLIYIFKKIKAIEDSI